MVSKGNTQPQITFDILPILNRRFPNGIRSEISLVRIVQNSEIVFLEITYEKSRDKQLITRTNMAIIADDYLGIDNTIEENSNRFLNLDEYSLIMITDNLFTDNFIEEIRFQNENNLSNDENEVKENIVETSYTLLPEDLGIELPEGQSWGNIFLANASLQDQLSERASRKNIEYEVERLHAQKKIIQFTIKRTILLSALKVLKEVLPYSRKASEGIRMNVEVLKNSVVMSCTVASVKLPCITKGAGVFSVVIPYFKRIIEDEDSKTIEIVYKEAKLQINDKGISGSGVVGV